jgi:hypothetical protein
MHILRANDSESKIMILAVMVSGLALSGCVSVPKYPDNWPSLTKTENKCAVLTGTYSDIGESAPNQGIGEAVSCFRTLFPDSEIKPTTVIDKITFKGPENGVLEITAWNSRVPIATRYLKEGKDRINFGLYHCYYDGSVLANCYVGIYPGIDDVIRAGGGIIPVITPAGGHENRLYSGEDGSLVLKRVEAIFVLPWWFRYIYRYYRFLPVSQDEGVE